MSKVIYQSDEVVIQHAEFRNYTNPCTGLSASKYGKVIAEKLNFPQKQQLCQEFALVLDYVDDDC